MAVGLAISTRGANCATITFCAGGIAGVILGLVLLNSRVVLTKSYISKRPRWLGGFSSTWSDIEGWFVVPYGHSYRKEQLRLWSILYGNERAMDFSRFLGSDESDSFTFRVLVFKVHGCKWPVIVREAEASRPSFDSLVASVRSYVPHHEVI